jgi:hypothetical protein
MKSKLKYWNTWCGTVENLLSSMCYWKTWRLKYRIIYVCVCICTHTHTHTHFTFQLLCSVVIFLEMTAAMLSCYLVTTIGLAPLILMFCEFSWVYHLNFLHNGITCLTTVSSIHILRLLTRPCTAHLLPSFILNFVNYKKQCSFKR